MGNGTEQDIENLLRFATYVQMSPPLFHSESIPH
jgi:hypothetical protein